MRLLLRDSERRRPEVERADLGSVRLCVSAAEQLPAVVEGAVVGIAIDGLVRIKAYVVTREGTGAGEDLRAELVQRPPPALPVPPAPAVSVDQGLRS